MSLIAGSVTVPPILQSSVSFLIGATGTAAAAGTADDVEVDVDVDVDVDVGDLGGVGSVHPTMPIAMAVDKATSVTVFIMYFVVADDEIN
jgi:hypothetical protein